MGNWIESRYGPKTTHDFSVIVDLARPMKVVRRSHIRTLVGHFLENITYDLEQNIWWGF